MSDRKGLFIAIEESGGLTGDSFFEKTSNKLKTEGYKVVTLSFPKYDDESSHFVREHQKGKYKGKEGLEAYSAGLFYALDRFAAADDIEASLEENLVVLIQNWSAANMTAHAEKLPNAETRRGFYVWLDNLEYYMFDMPRPDKTYMVKSPLGNGADSESKFENKIIDEVCRLFPKDFVCIDTGKGGKQLEKDQVVDIIYKSIKPNLPEKSEQGDELTAFARQKFIENSDGSYDITHKGREELKTIFTDTKNNVYGFKQTPSSNDISNILARFSQSDEPLDITALKTLGKNKKDEQKSKRLHNFDRHYLVFEDTSSWLVGQIRNVAGENLVTKVQTDTTQPGHFAHKDKPYYIPSSLDRLAETKYRAAMDNIYSLRQSILEKLKKEYLDKELIEEVGSLLLPFAHKQTAAACLSNKEIQRLIIELAITRQREAIETAKGLAKYIYSHDESTYHELIDNPEVIQKIKSGKDWDQKTSELANDLKSETAEKTDQSVKLLDFSPKNELDLLPHFLYPHTNLAYKVLEEKVSKWPIGKKTESFINFINPEGILVQDGNKTSEAAVYIFEIHCSQNALISLRRKIPKTQLMMQTLNMGYFIPEVITKIGLENEYEKSFSLSEKLIEALDTEGYGRERNLVYLGGHQSRLKVAIKISQLGNLIKKDQYSSYEEMDSLTQNIVELVSEKHPILSESALSTKT